MYEFYLHNTFSVMGRVKQKGAKDWNVNTVGQHSQVSLGELEGWAVLLNKLPHALQEQEEDWRMTLH